MPTVIRVEPGKLGQTIRADARNLSKVLKKGAKMGAQRGRSHMVKWSPVDRGVLKNAWEVQVDSSPLFGVELVNTAPYSGVMERGARPGGKYGKQVLEDLTQWVIRKILRAARSSSGKKRAARPKIGPMTPLQGHAATAEYLEAKGIAIMIIAKWKRVGREGTFFVKSQQGELTRIAVEEIMRQVEKYFIKGGGTSGDVQP